MSASKSESKAVHFLVAGRVQGVFFRASTRTQALQLGLIGYAKNLPDGRVEVVAKGDSAALATLNEWLWHGPPAAHVTEVQVLNVEADAVQYTGFVTL